MSLLKFSPLSQRLVAGNQLAGPSCRSMATVVDKIKEKAGEAMEKVGKAFEADGAVGSQFTTKGKVGGAAQQAADEGNVDPLDKKGSVGHQFTTDGAVGGKVQEVAEKADVKGKEMKSDAHKP